MRIEFGRKDTAKKANWEHPTTKRIRCSDILFLRFLIILTLLATMYLGPVKFIVLQCQQESTGVLNDTYVEAYRNRNIYRPNHILHVRIDGQWFQVKQSYSERDIQSINLLLSSAKGKEVYIQYVYGITTEPYLSQIRCGSDVFLSGEYFEQVWRKNAITNGVHGSVVILACIIVYMFRSGYIRVYRT